MKQTVIKLVSVIGRPPDKPFFDWATETQNRIIGSIIEGANSYAEITNRTGLKTPKTTLLNTLPYFAEMGFAPRRYNTKGEDLIRYIADKYRNNQAESIEEKEDKMYKDKDLNLEYDEKYCHVIDAIKKGYTKQIDIARESGIKVGTICFAINNLARFFNLNTGGQSARVVLIEFIHRRLHSVHHGQFNNEAANAQNKSTEPTQQAAVVDSQELEKEEEFIESQKIQTENAAADLILKLQKENDELREKIKTLEENKSKSFVEIKEKIKEKIETLRKKLELIEELEAL